MPNKPNMLEVMVDVIATQMAKREYGKHYEGYESSQREAAEIYASAAMGVVAAFERGPFATNKIRDVLTLDLAVLETAQSFVGDVVGSIPTRYQDAIDATRSILLTLSDSKENGK